MNFRMRLAKVMRYVWVSYVSQRFLTICYLKKFKY